jgi:hypothetical protein
MRVNVDIESSKTVVIINLLGTPRTCRKHLIKSHCHALEHRDSNVLFAHPTQVCSYAVQSAHILLSLIGNRGLQSDTSVRYFPRQFSYMRYFPVLPIWLNDTPILLCRWCSACKALFFQAIWACSPRLSVSLAPGLRRHFYPWIRYIRMLPIGRPLIFLYVNIATHFAMYFFLKLRSQKACSLQSSH